MGFLREVQKLFNCKIVFNLPLLTFVYNVATDLRYLSYRLTSNYKTYTYLHYNKGKNEPNQVLIIVL